MKKNTKPDSQTTTDVSEPADGRRMAKLLAAAIGGAGPVATLGDGGTTPKWPRRLGD